MTDRREQLMQAIAECPEGRDLIGWALQHLSASGADDPGSQAFMAVEGIIDAVLGAMDPDLLPELPDDVGQVWIHLMPKRSGNPYRKGTGPTLVAAICTALNGGEQ